jgi:hypothetical protein
MKKIVMIIFMVTGSTMLIICSPTASKSVPSRVVIIHSSDSATAPFPLLVFSKAAGARSYVVERRLNSGTGFDSIGTTADTTYTDVDTSLLPETIYFYKVKARNADGDGLFSDSVSALTPPFMILSPRQGDVFRIGDTIHALVKTSIPTSGGIKFGEGLNEITPPGITGTLSFYQSLVVSFQIPATIMPFGATTPVSAVSDSCYMRIFDYGTLETIAYSYGYFKVTN